MPVRVVRLLRESATVWTDAHAILWANERFYPESPQNGLIGLLISFVEQRAGRPHYTEVADLLNGIDPAQHGKAYLARNVVGNPDRDAGLLSDAHIVSIFPVNRRTPAPGEKRYEAFASS